MNGLTPLTNYVVGGVVPSGVRPVILETLSYIEELFYECDIC